jgi:hypothetical protein
MRAASVMFRSFVYLAGARAALRPSIVRTPQNSVGSAGTRWLCTAGSSGLEITDKDGISEFGDVPGVQTGGDKMILMFTCTVCDTRSARKISKRAYNEGIVMVRCAGCNNRHLIADRMGVFEDSIPNSHGGAKVGQGWDIQKYLQKEMGVQSKYVTDENVFELTMQDILGAKAAAVLKNNGVVGDGEANR